jgi:hypothetical protein
MQRFWTGAGSVILAMGLAYGWTWTGLLKDFGWINDAGRVLHERPHHRVGWNNYMFILAGAPCNKPRPLPLQDRKGNFDLFA